MNSDPTLDYTATLQTWMTRVEIASFRQLSLKAGVSLWQIQQLRRGKLPQMRLEVLWTLAEVLQVSLEEFLEAFTGRGERQKLLTEDNLQQEYQRLQQQLNQQQGMLQEEFETHSLQTLEAWLLQWYTVVAAVEKNPNLPASRLLPLVKPVEELIQEWGVEIIGPVGAEVEYNPQWHQCMEGSAAVGDRVRVRYVGYRHRGRLLHRAKISPI